jgi:hypothetical protein
MNLLLRKARHLLTAPSAEAALPPYLAARQTAVAEHEQLIGGATGSSVACWRRPQL